MPPRRLTPADMSRARRVAEWAAQHERAAKLTPEHALPDPAPEPEQARPEPAPEPQPEQGAADNLSDAEAEALGRSLGLQGADLERFIDGGRS